MNRLKLVFLTIFASVAAFAQATDDAPIKSAIKLYTIAPSDLFPLTDKTMRLDMVDYFEAGSETLTENLGSEGCRIIYAEPASVVVAEGESCVYQLFVIDQDGPLPVIGLIETLEAPIKDSSVRFYDTQWREIDAKKTAVNPVLSDWLTDEGKKHRKQVENEIPFLFEEMTFDPATQTLTVTNNTKSYFHPADTPESVKWLKPQLIYKWTGKKFKLSR